MEFLGLMIALILAIAWICPQMIGSWSAQVVKEYNKIIKEE